MDAAWRALLAFQVSRARDYFRRGALLAPMVHPASRICPLALASIYEGLLDRVEAARYDVFTTRVSLSARRKAALMGLSLGRAVLNRG